MTERVEQLLLIALEAAAFPCLLGALLLRFDPDARRDVHWSKKARVVASVRALLFASRLAFLLLVFFEYRIHRPANAWMPTLGSAAVVARNIASGFVLGKGIRRLHPFPNPSVRFEFTRTLAATYVPLFMLASPALLPTTTSLGLRVLASLGSLSSAAYLVFYSVLGLRCLGLVAPAPAPLVAKARTMIADVRVFVLRSILANAYALPFQRTVLFTHAALQVLKPAEAEAILAHELAHLTEGARANAVRAIPVLLMAGFFNAIAWFDATADSGGWVLGGVTLLLLPIASSFRERRRSLPLEHSTRPSDTRR